MNRILVAVGSYAPVAPSVYANHVAWLSSEANSGADLSFHFATWSRTPLALFRRQAAEVTLEKNFDALLFADDDVMVELVEGKSVMRTMLEQLEYHPVVCAPVFARVAPHNPMTFRFSADGNCVPFYSGKPYLADGASLAFTMIRRDELSRQSQVRGDQLFEPGESSDDIMFCNEVRRNGGTILVLPEIRTCHLGRPKRIGEATWLAHKQKAGQDEVGPMLA